MKRWIAGLALLVMAACETAPPVTPGATGALNIQDVVPPSGREYVYRIEYPQIGIVGQVNVSSERVSSSRMRYTGTMTVPVTADTVAEASAMASELGLEFSNDALRGRFRYTSDNRGRILEGRFFQDRIRYAPHDCFATPGVCQFTETLNGERQDFVTVTSEFDGVWQTVTALDEGETDTPSTDRELEVYSLDEDGVIIDSISLFLSEAGEFAIRVTRIR